MLPKSKPKRIKTKSSNNHNHQNIVLEISKAKPRPEEEKFYLHFSETQLNTVLLIILASTFLVQGVVKYLELVHFNSYIKPWFIMSIIAQALLVFSVFVLSLSGIISTLKTKRFVNVISFIFFALGFVTFLSSLLYLIIVMI